MTRTYKQMWYYSPPGRKQVNPELIVFHISQHVEHKCISTASTNCHMHALSTQLEFSYRSTKEFVLNVSLLLETKSLF